MSNNNFLNTCFFDKVIPNNDMAECSNHRSIAYFDQGIFNVSAYDINKYWEIDEFFNDNKDKIASIECYLLKHPLFNFPMEFYPYFMFVHHSQLGFKFLDKDGNSIRHMVIQLQNSHYPSTSNTKPFNVPTTCKIVNKQLPENDDVIIHLDDKTAIYADLLEPKNGTSDNIIEMNKYVYFQGLRLDFLKKTVNFNFFLQSYLLWRSINNIPDYKPKTEIELLSKSNCNQSNKMCGGSGDGSLFVFSGFSPAFLSQNEGCIMHFATISSKTNNTQNITEQFKNFMKWNFTNLNCYKNIETHSDSFSKHYITLSPASLNYNWCLKNGDKTTVDTLFSKLRPINGKKADWLTQQSWDLNDPSCALYDDLINKIINGKNMVQPNHSSNPLFSANDDNCPFLCQGENYTCEIYSRFMVSMLLNDDTWGKNSNNDVEVNPLFDFYFNNLNEQDMTFTDNLFRAYTAYWPVAVFDDGYENGVPESVFNTDAKFKEDKILYAKQSQLFRYLLNDDLIEASKVTQNPVIMVLAAFLGIPKLHTLINLIAGKNNQMSDKQFTTMTSILSSILYALFLYSFLGVQEVIVPGYPLRKVLTDSFQYEYVIAYDCEPSIYKFQIGDSSRAAIANNKCLEAYIKWITKESNRGPLAPFVSISPTDDDITKKIKQDLINALDEFKDAFTGKDNKDPDEVCSKVPATFKDICKNMVIANNDINEFKHLMAGGKDIIDAAFTMLTHPFKFAKVFAVAFYNYIRNIYSIVSQILTVDLDRFTILCHQNYSFHPQILVQRNFDTKTPYGFADFRRPSTGICSQLKCDINIEKKPTLQLFSANNDNIRAKKFQANYKLTNPYRDQAKKDYSNLGFHVTLVLCIILFICVAIFVGSRIYKKLHA
jgi:hypothetical protein